MFPALLTVALMNPTIAPAPTADPPKKNEKKELTVKVTIYDQAGKVTFAGERKDEIKWPFTTTAKVVKFDPKTGKVEAVFDGVAAFENTGGAGKGLWVTVSRQATGGHLIEPGDRITVAGGRTCVVKKAKIVAGKWACEVGPAP